MNGMPPRNRLERECLPRLQSNDAEPRERSRMEESVAGPVREVGKPYLLYHFILATTGWEDDSSICGSVGWDRTPESLVGSLASS